MGPVLIVCLDIMANTKPFVQLACFCESILVEKDGVPSAIRIVDTYFIPPLPEGVALPDGMQGAILLNGMIALKSGDVVGPGNISLIMNKTTGERVELSPPGGWPVVMNGGEHGANVMIHMPIGVKNFGLIWFDVLWNQEVLTRIPLKLQRGEKPVTTIAPTERTERIDADLE
jgi:hypothetical protein